MKYNILIHKHDNSVNSFEYTGDDIHKRINKLLNRKRRFITLYCNGKSLSFNTIYVDYITIKNC